MVNLTAAAVMRGGSVPAHHTILSVHMLSISTLIESGVRGERLQRLPWELGKGRKLAKEQAQLPKVAGRPRRRGAPQYGARLLQRQVELAL
jgi:hypothetical protein